MVANGRPFRRRTKDSYLSAQYRRIAARRGPNKAAVAVANSIAGAIWHVLTKHVSYEDLGGDYFERRKNPDKEARRLVAPRLFWRAPCTESGIYFTSEGFSVPIEPSTRDTGASVRSST